jgi:nucleotide-binding universal stress UspA family protein
MGSRGMGPVKRLVLGSVSEGIVHHARCPVLVLRGGQAA